MATELSPRCGAWAAREGGLHWIIPCPVICQARDRCLQVVTDSRVGPGPAITHPHLSSPLLCPSWDTKIENMIIYDIWDISSPPLLSANNNQALIEFVLESYLYASVGDACAHNVFIFMFRLLIIPCPRLNEATCLVVAHDCSVCQAQTIEYRRQSLPSLFIPGVQISASTNKHFIGFIICGPIFNEINFLDEGIVSSETRDYSFCLLLMICSIDWNVLSWW